LLITTNSIISRYGLEIFVLMNCILDMPLKATGSLYYVQAIQASIGCGLSTTKKRIWLLLLLLLLLLNVMWMSQPVCSSTASPFISAISVGWLHWWYVSVLSAINRWLTASPFSRLGMHSSAARKANLNASWSESWWNSMLRMHRAHLLQKKQYRFPVKKQCGICKQTVPLSYMHSIKLKFFFLF